MTARIVPLPASVYSHADIMQSIWIAMRDAVRRKKITPEKCERVMAIASRFDCGVAKRILEEVLELTR